MKCKSWHIVLRKNISSIWSAVDKNASVNMHKLAACTNLSWIYNNAELEHHWNRNVDQLGVTSGLPASTIIPSKGSFFLHHVLSPLFILLVRYLTVSKDLTLSRNFSSRFWNLNFSCLLMVICIPGGVNSLKASIRRWQTACSDWLLRIVFTKMEYLSWKRDVEKNRFRVIIFVFSSIKALSRH